MIVIDGSAGEGGGQILRTSIALSLITNKKIRIENIRANRRNPGLQRQHLAAVKAAAEIGGAMMKGAEIGSSALLFEPGIVQAGDYHFSTGSAGSTTLVLQTILPPLMLAASGSRITLEGGTHNPLAPPFDFLQKTFLPLINKMGPQVDLTLNRYGFYPAGGGILKAEIAPSKLSPRQWLQRGNIKSITASALVARLPRQIAERELAVVRQSSADISEYKIIEISDSAGPGNAVLIEVEAENITEVFTGFGGRGIRAEDVAAHAVSEFQQYTAMEVFADEHLADQLMLPLSLAGSGSFTTGPISGHSVTNIEIIRKFLPLHFEITKHENGTCTISVE